MVQKHIVISMIAPVAVLGVLTLSVLAAISSTNQAFAQNISPILHLNVVCEQEPCKGGAAHTREGNLVILHLFGSLTFEGRGVKGVDITLKNKLGSHPSLRVPLDEGITVTTDGIGHFKTITDIGPGVHTITAEAHFVDAKQHEHIGSAEHTITVYANIPAP
jgi:hypothetical protein